MIKFRLIYCLAAFSQHANLKSCICEAACLSTWSPSWLPLQSWQLQHCTLGYRTPWHDDSDESVCSLPCGPHQIHPTGKQVCLTDPDQTCSLTHIHTDSNTHFPWPLLHATPLIPIGLSLWLQIFFTCSWHPPRSSWISVATTKAHNSLYSGVQNHRILSPGYLLTWFVKLFRPQRLQRVALCGWRSSQIPLRHVWWFLYCVYNTASRGVC